MDSGIGRLMDDLGEALTSSDTIFMLGGGNPAHIPEVEEALRRAMLNIVHSPSRFGHMIGDYDPPHGNRAFADALCGLLTEQGWSVGPENIALTNGSQSAFFALFNMLAGTFSDGTQRKILLPLIPEYIGYNDVGLEPDLFVSARPAIEHLDGPLFKYRVDFDRIESLLKEHHIGAMCVSRPTNPTGNVVTDEETQKLTDLAKQQGIPLIIDSAYGLPFPGIIFDEAQYTWDRQTILSLSLSKLGLPGTRTGIVIAAEDHIEALSRMNAITSLAPGGVGATLATELIQTGQMMHLSRNVLRPYYKKKCDHAVRVLSDALKGHSFHVHKPQGAFFLWLWLPDLPITSQQLYRRLKDRGVILVPGDYFFPGLKETWAHSDQCLRISYAQEDEIIEQGMALLAEEVARAHTE